jgi:hypothetical protein
VVLYRSKEDARSQAHKNNHGPPPTQRSHRDVKSAWYFHASYISPRSAPSPIKPVTNAVKKKKREAAASRSVNAHLSQFFNDLILSIKMKFSRKRQE